MYGLHKSSIINLCLTLVIVTISQAQISKLTDFTNYNSPTIGVYQGITFREAGFSGLYPIPNTNGREFWTCSDRGVNIDAANANSSACRPTYDKIYAFPSYAPKIHRIRIIGNSVQVLQTITIKRPNNTPASGLINPTGLGSTLSELASTDTVMDCANFLGKTIAKDTFGIDSEGLIVDKSGNFWICEEGGPTIWKVNRNGVLIARYTPYANLPGVQSVYIQIDSVFKYRKNNRGFEGIAIAPNGKIYAIIQSPILYPSRTVGEASRIHRILEIDPATNAQRMFVYLNDGIIGASGSNQIRLRDWKIGDMAAVNDTTFLVLEAAIRGTSDIRRLYRISLNGASVVHSGLYNGLTLEALVDSVGLTANGIVPVRKTLVMDLLANGWPSQLDKAEGLAIMNDSTIAIGNDNDYGQISPLENGIATATGNESHVITFRLSGVNKLQHFLPVIYGLNEGITGVSTEKTPYMTPIIPSAKFTSLMTVGDSISTYKMSGLMDGMGAYDNNNGTFTLLINHEISNSLGKVRAHGNTGAYVSKWVINKSDLQVVSGSDLISKVNLWNGSGYTTYTSSSPMPVGFSRFCAAELAMPSAFYNTATGLGTQERIYLNGEESGVEGRAFAHILTGVNTGTTYELPYLGKYSWENAVASPYMSNKTVVAGLDDVTGGQVYFYIGTKSNSGNEVDKAGLTNGKLYGVAVNGLLSEVSTSFPTANTAFRLADLGMVQNMTGASLQTASVNAQVTNFLRPEDGAWDPQNPQDFYFVTTNAFGSPSRMWRLRFTNPEMPEQGGTITAVLDGTEGQQMLDNLTVDNYGHVLLQEDPGNNSHLAKVWEYTIATDKLKLVATHDSTRFVQGGANYLTQDEESSGIIDMLNILGPGMFLIADQAHYPLPGELVEGGQLLAFFNPGTFISAMGAGISSSQTPYMQSSVSGGRMTSIMTVGDSIGSYKMSGLMDGMGAYDNNNGTFTLLINHEISSSLGKVRAHGNTGAYVSKWVLNKKDLQVVSGSDLISKVNLWNGSGYTTYTSSSPMPVGFSRFCSADIALPSAYYNTATGLGTQERIYLNGEESGIEGRAFAHIVTGANAGTTYELPYLGKFSWENAVASPTMSNKTIVAGLDDGTGGQVYFYIGTKTSVGTEIDKAGLSNGKLFGVSVTGLATEISASVPTPNTNFGLVDLGTVQNMTGATLNTNSVNAAVTTFLRPEDGAWDPSNPRDFYFVTTNAFGSPSKMWRLRFNNIATPETGGTITAVLDGTEGQQMLDNLTIDNYGHILLQEDPGNNVHIAKMWEYTIATDKLKLVAQHDTTRFIQGGANYLTQDEESSGIIDVQSILGPGMFLVAQQSHYSIPGELVEGGQLLTFFNPETFNKSEEISVRGNNFDIVNGDNTPDVSDNTDFGVTRVGAILRKNFTLTNTGPVSLTVSGVSFTGIGSTDFEIAGVQFPIIIAPFSNRIVPIDFRPLTEGNRRINVVITNSDYNEGQFTFTIQANALSSKMSVKGNNRIIQNGDVTPSAENNTDFGNVKINTKVTKTFNVVNDGQSSLTISKVSISGSGSSRFTSLTSVPLVVAPNSSATISIQFQPVAEEKSVANVQIQHDVAFNSSYTFAIAGAGFTTKPDIILFGNGQEITQRDSTPSPTDLTDFGITFIGEKNNHEFSIKNTGSENLDITSIGIQGIDANEFTVLGVPSFPVSISVGSMSNFTIRFEPKSQGIKKSVLTIKSNVSSKEYNVMLQGNAQISTDVIGESSESFFDIYPNPSSEECTVSIQLLQEANVNVSLFNSQGSEVFISGNQQLQSGNHYIPVKLDTLSAGMYVIRLTINNKTFSKRLILQH